MSRYKLQATFSSLVHLLIHSLLVDACRFSGMRSSDFMYKIMSIKLALNVLKIREIT